MKRYCLIFWLLTLNVIGYAQSYNGKIVKVVDGDTYLFQITNETLKVRMYAIDAPEGDQPFGKESREFISKYIHKDAMLVTDGHDRYKRTLGTLFIHGQDINLLSVMGGYAWHYKRYLDNKQYAAAQENAKKNKLGLWGLSNPIPPWNWRRNEKKNIDNHYNTKS